MVQGALVAVIALSALLAPALPPAVARADTSASVAGETEERKAEIYHTREERREAGLARNITERITLSGLLELEASYEDLDLEEGGEQTGDLMLSTVQLGFEVEIIEQLGLTVVLVYEEEDEDAFGLDEATVDFEEGGWEARLGLQDLPSGLFPSHMVSSPLTEDLGEIQAVALSAGYGGESFEVTLFAFDGADEAAIDSWGFQAIVRPLPFVEAAASYFSDLTESDAGLVDTPTDEMGAWSVAGVVSLGDIELLGEVLSAAERFEPADLDADGDGEGDRPLAWNVEAAWEIMDALEAAVRVEGSSEFHGEPELQYGACLSWGPWRHVSLSVEYLRGEFDTGFGDGVRSRNLVTSELAVEY